MKKTYILILIVICSITVVNAQYYTGINYQGYFLNYEFSGEQTLRITLLKDSQNGPVIYMEEYLVTVVKGLFNIVIGQGNPQGSYNFGEIEWNRHTAVFCKVEWIRTFQDKLLSVSQLMSVPFALYAESAGRRVDTIITINNPSWPLHINIPEMDFVPSKVHLGYEFPVLQSYYEEGINYRHSYTFHGSLKYYDLKKNGNAMIMDRLLSIIYYEEGDEYNHTRHLKSTTNKALFEFDFRPGTMSMSFDIINGRITINKDISNGITVNNSFKIFLIAENL